MIDPVLMPWEHLEDAAAAPVCEHSDEELL
jgi:hypothetical protein